MSEEFIEIITRVVDDSSLSKEEKLGYIHLVEMVLSGHLKDAKEKEDKCYTIKGKPLSNKQRINYELNRLYETGDDDTIKEVRRILYQFERKKEADAVEKAKERITRLQISAGITPTFYSVFERIAQGLKDEEKKSTYRK